ncbi:unnamed protein product [Arabis nemorensis]|uniref:Uncharacterized protein n=1 Tax=Arabis nemorensis TaxID=586526 RepID=A0A565BFP3_9BRAS|nr:unnamed protein product [Arabis nemorensis]
MQDHDLVSINSITSFVINLLSNEPGHVTKGLGGIGLGAAQALYLGCGYAIGWTPIDLKVVVALNGWLPARKNFNNNLGTIIGALWLQFLKNLDYNVPTTSIRLDFQST